MPALHRSAIVAFAWLVFGAGSSGCAVTPIGSDPPDGSGDGLWGDQVSDLGGDVSPTDAAVAWVGGSSELGEGFVVWDDGQQKPAILRGPQGGQHIWVSARAKGLWPKKIRIAVTMYDLTTGEKEPVSPGRVEITSTLKTDQQDPAWMLYAGVPAFVKYPCKIQGHRIRVDLELSDLYGDKAVDSAEIWPTWDLIDLCPEAGSSKVKKTKDLSLRTSPPTTQPPQTQRSVTAGADAGSTAD